MNPLTDRLRRTVIAALACTLVLAPVARAQQMGEIPTKDELLKVSVAPLTVAAGASGDAVLTLTILSGWHVNANPPAPDMIPTKVTLKGDAGITSKAPAYPEPKKTKLSFSEDELLVWDGTTTIQVPVTIAATATNGAHTLHGVVDFQSCNDQVCLPPMKVPFTVALTVTGGAAPGAATTTTPAPSAEPTSERGPPAADTTTASMAAPEAGGPDTTGGHASAPPVGGDIGGRLSGALAGGAFGWFFALFVGGLALNLTPCVFPMLGITVSVFGARRKEPPAKVMSHAIAYVLGICLTYSVLGVIAALTGGLFGAALQNAWVNVALGALFVVLALSMFGLYEFQPPASLMTRLGGSDNSSLLGIFASGLAVGVIAAPCVGPFVVAVLALIAQKGNVLFGFQTMFAMSIGLGFPYLFLALFSNLLQSLPRSGDWMLWVKQVFGVLMVAIGLNYVLNGLQPGWAPWVMPAALLLGGVYLGFVSSHGSKKPAFRAFRAVAGIGGIIAGLIAGDALMREGVRFSPYDEHAVQAAFASGRPVMMDFSASWCLPCHELEQNTFTHGGVKNLASRFATFKVDLTRYDAPESQALRSKFGVTGVPEVLFFTPDGKEVRNVRVIGFLAPEPFLQRMHQIVR